MDKLSQFVVKVKHRNGFLLFNSLNKGLVFLAADEMKEIDVALTGQAKKTFLYNSLNKMEFIVDNEVKEFSILEEKYWDFRNSEKLIKIVIAPTLKCNLDCSYCFEREFVKNNMSKETMHNVLKKIKHKIMDKKTESVFLTWYGGEPLLNWEAIVHITKGIKEFCDDSRILFGSNMITNGVKFTENKAKILSNLNCNSVQFTFDGDKNEHDKRRKNRAGEGTFDIIVNSILIAEFHGINVNIRVNIDRDNLYSITSLIDRLAELPVEKINLFFAPIEDIASYKSNKNICVKEFSYIQSSLIEYAVNVGFIKCAELPIVKFGFCEGVSRNNILISPSGDNFYCWENVDISNKNKSEVSTIKEFYHNTYSFSKEECRTCSIFPLCLGGCPKRKLELGKAPCPALKYNIKKLIKIYYENYDRELSI